MAGYGLKLARTQGMEGMTGNTQEFPVNPADTNAIFAGDPVVLNGGFVEEASGNGATTPHITPILGIFQGCRYTDIDGSIEFRPYWDGTGGREDIMASVTMPAHMMFKAKLSGPATQAAVGTRRGLNYNAGSTAYGDSRFTVGAVNAAGPVIIHRLVDEPGNAWTNAEPIVEVAVVAVQGTFADAS